MNWPTFCSKPAAKSASCSLALRIRKALSVASLETVCILSILRLIPSATAVCSSAAVAIWVLRWVIFATASVIA